MFATIFPKKKYWCIDYINCMFHSGTLKPAFKVLIDYLWSYTFFSMHPMSLQKFDFNTASTQDTANTHTNQMGDFIDPPCFSRALPPNQSPHRMGVSGPT